MSIYAHGYKGPCFNSWWAVWSSLLGAICQQYVDFWETDVPHQQVCPVLLCPCVGVDPCSNCSRPPSGTNQRHFATKSQLMTKVAQVMYWKRFLFCNQKHLCTLSSLYLLATFLLVGSIAFKYCHLLFSVQLQVAFCTLSYNYRSTKRHKVKNIRLFSDAKAWIWLQHKFKCLQS